MLCKLCNQNETDSTSGICWKCFNFRLLNQSLNQFPIIDKYPYPKIDEDNDWRKRLTVRYMIQTLFEGGFSVNQMSILFNVSKHAIRNYLLLPEIVREKRRLEPSYRQNYGKSKNYAYAKRTRRRVLIGEMLPYEKQQRENQRLKKK